MRFEPFISRSRSDGDFSGLIRRDPRVSGFPLRERDGESPQRCQTAAMLLRGRLPALTSPTPCHPAHPPGIAGEQLELQPRWTPLLLSVRFIHRGLPDDTRNHKIDPDWQISCLAVVCLHFFFLVKRKKRPKTQESRSQTVGHTAFPPSFCQPLLWVIIDLSISASSSPLHTSQTLAKCFPLGTGRASLTNCAYVHGVCLISVNISPHRGPPERCKWLCPITSLRLFFIFI